MPWLFGPITSAGPDVALDRHPRRSGTESASCFPSAEEERDSACDVAPTEVHVREQGVSTLSPEYVKTKWSLSGDSSFARKSPIPVDERLGVSW